MSLQANLEPTKHREKLHNLDKEIDLEALRDSYQTQEMTIEVNFSESVGLLVKPQTLETVAIGLGRPMSAIVREMVAEDNNQNLLLTQVRTFLRVQSMNVEVVFAEWAAFEIQNLWEQNPWEQPVRSNVFGATHQLLYVLLQQQSVDVLLCC